MELDAVETRFVGYTGGTPAEVWAYAWLEPDPEERVDRLCPAASPRCQIPMDTLRTPSGSVAVWLAAGTVVKECPSATVSGGPAGPVVALYRPAAGSMPAVLFELPGRLAPTVASWAAPTPMSAVESALRSTGVDVRRLLRALVRFGCVDMEPSAFTELPWTAARLEPEVGVVAREDSRVGAVVLANVHTGQIRGVNAAALRVWLRCAEGAAPVPETDCGVVAELLEAGMLTAVDPGECRSR
jgi:hypothetical protein